MCYKSCSTSVKKESANFPTQAMLDKLNYAYCINFTQDLQQGKKTDVHLRNIV